MEMQGSGRVTPDVLKPVRVVLPESQSQSDGEVCACALEEVATVGVRDGTTILVTVFAENVRPLFLVFIVISKPAEIRTSSDIETRRKSHLRS